MLIFGGTLEVSGGWCVTYWLYAGGVCVGGGGGVSCAKLWWCAGSVCLSLGHRLKVCGVWCQ